MGSICKAQKSKHTADPKALQDSSLNHVPAN